MPFFWLPDKYYILLVLPAALLALWAQVRVKSTFARYSRERTYSGLTGAETARRILDANGLYDVRVEHISGQLTDHYDPTQKVVRLSDDVYGRATIAAVGVAAHETGHALQHADSYVPMQIRSAIIPITNIGSQLSIPMILIGYIFGFQPLVAIGILLFSLMTVFQLVTLPVEFNASRRALTILEGTGMLSGQENAGARKVLTAAALTYVAALIVSLANLLRLILLLGNRRDD